MYSSNAASSGAGIRTLGVRQPSQSYAAIATSAAAAQSAKLTPVGGQSRLAARYFSSFRDRNRWTERRAYCINNSHSIVVWAKRVDRFLLSRRGGRAVERGFTLIEIFIAVAVVAILVAIALPAYKQYVARAKSAVAKADIARINIAVERAYTDSGNYPQTLADIHLDTKLDPWGRPYVYYNIAANGKGHARKDHALNRSIAILIYTAWVPTESPNRRSRRRTVSTTSFARTMVPSSVSRRIFKAWPGRLLLHRSAMAG